MVGGGDSPTVEGLASSPTGFLSGLLIASAILCPNFFSCALTLLQFFFRAHLEYLAAIFFCAHLPCCALIFFCAHLMCCYLAFHLPCCAPKNFFFPRKLYAVVLSCFSLTLLCSNFFSRALNLLCFNIFFSRSRTPYLVVP